jgi:NADPH:quinone reductase-like Zn-dependent oxidoreductase
MVMGHEFMGIVEEVGKAVTKSKKRRPRGCAFPDFLRALFFLPT